MQPADFGIGRLFWAIHEAIVVADVDSGEIVLWNPAAEQLFGYSATEVVGRPIEIVIPERLRPAYRGGLGRFRDEGGPLVSSGRPVELPALTKAGLETTVELTLSRIEAVGGEGRFVLAVIRDVRVSSSASTGPATWGRPWERVSGSPGLARLSSSTGARSRWRADRVRGARSPFSFLSERLRSE